MKSLLATLLSFISCFGIYPTSQRYLVYLKNKWRQEAILFLENSHFSKEYTSTNIEKYCFYILNIFITIFIFYRPESLTQSCELFIFSQSLLILSFIDFKEQLLPDTITLSMLWVGLLVNSNHTFTTPTAAIAGAIIGYLTLFVIYQLHLILTKKEGLGQGDIKMLAMLGAWAGAKMILPIFILAAFLSLLFFLLILLFVHKKVQRIAFGPFLALSGWVALMFPHTFANLLNR